MPRQIIVFTLCALSALAAPTLAQDAAQSGDQTAIPAEEPAAETPEQIAARELCTETAAPGAYRGWSIREGKTCRNSFVETCRVVRKADNVDASYACFTPLPTPDPVSEPDVAPEPDAGP